MKNILYVDSEPHAAHALQTAMHAMRDRFKVHSADTAENALAALKQGPPFEIVMADIRLSDMRGDLFLERVQVLQPKAVRIILTAYADQKAAMKTIKVAHQFLSKPCSSDVIAATLLRCLRLKNVFLNEQTAKIVAAVDALPTLPEAYLRLMDELNREYPSIAVVAKLIGSDVSMTASILKLINSSFFGLYERVSDPARAISLLGMEIVKGVVLGEKLFRQFPWDNYRNFSLGGLQDHSRRTALFARKIATMEGLAGPSSDTAFLGGMLHDLGKLLLATKFEAAYMTVLETSRRENIPLLKAEQRKLGYSHAEIGAYLLGLWGFSDELVEAVYAHHVPGRYGYDGFSPAAAVHVANSLDHELYVFNDEYAEHPPDRDWLEANGLGGRFESWRSACAEMLPDKENKDGGAA